MKSFFFCLFFASFTSLFPQQKLSKEIGFVNDNDLYASFSKDQYYTNGLFISYRTLAGDFGKLSKKIYEFEIGQEIYTPFRPNVPVMFAQDRPFAGYLFGSFGTIRAFKKESILKSKIQLGIVGEDAFGEEFQNFIHDIYNFKMPSGWEYQIRNTLALNLDFHYVKPLYKEYTSSDINFVSKLRIGTIFNELTTGFMGRIGLKDLQRLDNTIAFNTNLNNENTDKVRSVESFFYYEGYLTYVVRDATIEGSLFNDRSPVTRSPHPFRVNLEIGYRFTANRWIFGYGYHFHTNKLPNLRNNNGNVYARLSASYLFN